MLYLPSGWVTCELDEVLIKMSNGANVIQYEEKVGYPISRIETIWNEGIDLERVKYIKENDAGFINKYALKYGDILLSHINSDAHLGKTGLFKGQANVLIHGINILLLRPATEMSPDFLNYQLKNLRARGAFIDAAQRAVNQSSINQKKLKSFAIILAPLNEQHRIVAKIEELFSELDKGIENLKTAQAQLKVYRQALLKHAFEGKLTTQWRAENPNKLETADALLKRIQQERTHRYQQQLTDWETKGKQSSKPKAQKFLLPLTTEELAKLPELPGGWGWEKLGNIADLIGGVTKGKKLDGKEKLSLPYLRVANVQDGYLNLTEIKNIEVEKRDKDKYRLEFGDVLYTEGGDKDKLGRGAVWRSQIESCIHQNHIFRARVFDGVISPEILSLYSQTKSAKKYFFRHAKQTTNLASINLTVLGNLPVVILCQSEQKQILQEIEARLSEVDQLEQTITTSLQQAGALRQSILKKAFSGQLVAQDANDEPASVLLARIKAEKAVQTNVAKSPNLQEIQPAPSKSNVIPFPVKILNISTTDLHAGIIARAYQFHEKNSEHLAYYGHVKAEKISHLVEAHLGIDLDRMPFKDAAGPNDYPHLKKVESRALKANWFQVRQAQKDGAYVFSKQHGFDALLNKTTLALADRLAEVDALLKLLLPMNTRQAEIVATLYAAWNNLLLLGQLPNDENIVTEARENWHEAKLKIERERFFRALGWMREHGLVPVGRGRYVEKKSK